MTRITDFGCRTTPASRPQRIHVVTSSRTTSLGRRHGHLRCVGPGQGCPVFGARVPRRRGAEVEHADPDRPGAGGGVPVESILDLDLILTPLPWRPMYDLTDHRPHDVKADFQLLIGPTFRATHTHHFLVAHRETHTGCMSPTGPPSSPPPRLPSLLSGPNLVYALCPVRDSIAVAGEDCVRLYMWGTVAAHQARQQQITQQQQMAQQQAGHQRVPAPTPGQDGGPGSGSGGASAPRKRRRAVPISCNVLLQSAGVSAMCTATATVDVVLDRSTHTYRALQPLPHTHTCAG